MVKFGLHGWWAPMIMDRRRGHVRDLYNPEDAAFDKLVDRGVEPCVGRVATAAPELIRINLQVIGSPSKARDALQTAVSTSAASFWDCRLLHVCILRRQYSGDQV